MVGKTLGHYQIIGEIGKGGMGEVYQAKDQKLRRDVAIKILPQKFSRDPERVARFQREAELLASLNHSNIAAIYGLEEFSGTQFLVLELVEGETLADQLTRGALSFHESLNLALQITEALEAAHEKGIIHRDLKPTNIKVTPGGKVKVLDFGLAKAFASEQTDLNMSDSPTLSNVATMQGVILGTAAYMSPEQARGKTVDKRTDIWAFGCVLFEMLTGSAAFQGEDVTEILAAVVKGSANLDLLPANVHSRVREAIHRCLQKDLKRRYTSITDARYEIEQALADANGLSETLLATAGHPAKPRRIFPWIAAATVLSLIIGGAAVWNFKPTEPRQVIRLVHNLPEGQQFANQMWTFIAISPDGSQYAYSATDGLFLRSLGEWDARRVSRADENTACPCFSPDGQWIGYWSMTDSKLKKVSVNGGSPQPLCDTDPSGQVLDASWSEDDRIVYSETGKGILSISSSGGIPETLIPNENEMLFGPRLLPDGKTVIYTFGTVPYQVALQSVNSDQRKVLFTVGDTARYLPTGHVVYTLDYNLYAVPFDLDALQAGKSLQVVEGLFRSDYQYMPQYSVSSSGALLYVPKAATAATSGNTLVWVDRHGKEEPVETQPNIYYSLRLSPDGTRVALGAEIDGNGDIYLLDLARNNARKRLTFDKGEDSIPLWSPDGQRIAFSSNRHGEISVYSKAADGTGKEEPVDGSAVPGTSTFPLSWSGDGKTMVLMESFSTAGVSDFGIGALATIGDRKYRPLLKEKYHEFQPQISPNGRWMAYVSNETGRAEIYVRPFPDVDSGRWQVSTEGGNSPLWSRNGQELFYRNGNAVMAVAVRTEPTFDIVGTPQPLFRGAYLSQPRRLVNTRLQAYLWDVSPDGKRFLMMKDAGTTASTRINIVLNWFNELKQRVPKK